MADISHIKQLAFKLSLFNIAKGIVKLNGYSSKELDAIEEVLIDELAQREKNRIKNNKEASKLPNIKFDKKKIIDGVRWQIKEIEKLKFIED